MVAKEANEQYGYINHLMNAADVVNGSRVIVDILTKSRAAERNHVPMRVVLESDFFTGIPEKIKETVKLLDEWESITTKTNHE
jgi:DNA-binding MarR family transcriptional regulator